MTRQINLAIKMHAITGSPFDDLPCALCGVPIMQRNGLALCLLATGSLVCDECGQEHEPALVSLIELTCSATVF